MSPHALLELYQWYQSAITYLAFTGAFSAFLIVAINHRKESKGHKALWIFSSFSLIAPILHSFIYFVLYFSTDGRVTPQLPHPATLVWLGCFIGGIGLVAAWLRFAPQHLNKILSNITKKTELERNRKTDVRTIHEHLPEPLNFDPINFIGKEKGVFVGLNENEKPVHIGFGGSTSAPHCEVVGTTGAGKGVLLGLMASQFLEQNEAVFYCDPKDDEWAPHVLHAAAKRSGKPFHFIKLSKPNGAQFDLFRGATEEEAFELMQAGFGLTEKGDASDFYGIADRREAGKTAKLMAEEGMTIAQVYAARREELENPENGAAKFAGRLREMAETPSINASNGEGVDLEKIIEEGGCVYVVGSMRNDIVKTVQRILLVRLIQLAERRDRLAGTLRPVCIVLDEVKYHLSRPALEALGAARDKGVHLVLAHQSLGDLRDCTKDLNPDAVVDAVVENCRLKAVYQVQSPVTAEWLAAMSGTIQVDDETRKVRRNISAAETVDPERSIKQAERFFIDTNMILNMPKSVCVLYGAGLPQFVAVLPMRVEKDRAAITIKTVQGEKPKTAREALAL